jgi:hypothetical protein
VPFHTARLYRKAAGLSICRAAGRLCRSLSLRRNNA